MVTRRTFSPVLLVLLTVIAALACASTFGAAQPPAKTAGPYRILVANDDGVRAPGLLAVAQALQALGEVTIIAPADNQSGKGHSITIAEPIFRDEVVLAGGLRATSLTATPVSTVKVALAKILTNKPDLVVSGINRGTNLGLAAYLSGTASAAREAASQGIPAIASSLSMPATDYTAAAEVTLRIARVREGARAAARRVPQREHSCRNVADIERAADYGAVDVGGRHSRVSPSRSTRVDARCTGTSTAKAERTFRVRTCGRCTKGKSQSPR